MKILMVSLLKRKIAPDTTASRPRMIYELTKQLLKRGHEVTIVGTADSEVPGAQIIGVIPKSFVELPPFENPLHAEMAYMTLLSKKVEEIASSFDVIHNHAFPESMTLFVGEHTRVPVVTTLHVQATPVLDEALSLFQKTHLVAISKAHRSGFTKAPIEKVVYNGVDTSLYSYEEKKDDYMLWIGRLSKAKTNDGSFMDPKGVKWAIALAEKTRIPLKLSGNVEDQVFFDTEVKPHLSDRIQWIGNVSSEQPLGKKEVVSLMQKAKVFLMTVNWEEPFGLVMAEAGSCGTPVIGFNKGAVSEVVEDGVTGFVVEAETGLDGLEEALGKIETIQPKACRDRIETKFSIERMVDEYESYYQSLAKK